MKTALTIATIIPIALCVSSCSADSTEVDKTEAKPMTKDGALIKEIGEWAGYNCSDDTLESCAVQFKLDEVDTATGCTGFGYSALHNDPSEDTAEYIRLTATVKMKPSADEMNQNFGSDTVWNALDSDGTTRPLDEEYFCAGDDISFSDFWSESPTPGETVERRTLYKLPEGTEKLVLVDHLFGTRWEWDMP